MSDAKKPREWRDLLLEDLRRVRLNERTTPGQKTDEMYAIADAWASLLNQQVTAVSEREAELADARRVLLAFEHFAGPLDAEGFVRIESPVPWRMLQAHFFGGARGSDRYRATEREVARRMMQEERKDG